MALLQAVVEQIEREARPRAGLRPAAERHLVAARHHVDAETLLDHGEVLVELAEERRQ